MAQLGARLFHKQKVGGSNPSPASSFMSAMFKILSVCKGGGYRYCRTEPPHPKRNSMGLYPLHRVLAENRLGRLLKNGEDVHHVDENKENDSPKNLEVKTHADHSRHHHRPLEPAEVTCICGEKVLLKPYVIRLRLSRNKFGRLFCSRSCGAKFQHENCIYSI